MRELTCEVGCAHCAVHCAHTAICALLMTTSVIRRSWQCVIHHFHGSHALRLYSTTLSSRLIFNFIISFLSPLLHRVPWLRRWSNSNKVHYGIVLLFGIWDIHFKQQENAGWSGMQRKLYRGRPFKTWISWASICLRWSAMLPRKICKKMGTSVLMT